VNEQAEPGTRAFEVRYGPKRWLGLVDSPSNNLKLSGAGRVEIVGDVVRFSDARNLLDEPGRSMALSEIADVGREAHEEAQPVVAVRTLQGDREVLLWMASKEDASALVELLPKTTTPEFVARREQHRKFQEDLASLAPRAPVTPTIIGINVAVFAIMLVAGASMWMSQGSVELRFGSNYGPLTWHGQPWRLLTAAFIHFGMAHLLLNMYALLSAGDITERLYGSTRFAVIYLLSALAGNVVSGWWDASRNSAGASGAVFGVFAALLVFVLRRPGDIPRDILKNMRISAALMLLYSLGLGFIVPMIDNAAHVGGLLGGALAGLLLVRPFDAAARTRARPWSVVTAIAVVAVLLAALAAQVISSGAARQASAAADYPAALLAEQHRLELRFMAVLGDVENRRIMPANAAAVLRRQVIAQYGGTARSWLARQQPGDDPHAIEWLTAWKDRSQAYERWMISTAEWLEAPGEASLAAQQAAERRAAQASARFHQIDGAQSR